MVSINVLNLSFLIGMAVIAAVAALFLSRLRMLRADKPAIGGALPAPERYRPMLRLLREEEFAVMRGNPAALRRMRQQRRKVFRGYLRCLAADYGRMLAGIRRIMVHSPTDRSDLAKALVRYQTSFAVGLCRIEIHLCLSALGLSTVGLSNVDVSGLLRTLESLRAAQAGLLSPVPVAA